jgi:predicted N-formylglutamate amidohydrolase
LPCGPPAVVRAIGEIVNSMVLARQKGATLLGPADPEPVEIVNPDGGSVFLLVCEHAGRAIPSALRDLGIARAELERHIAYDIGAAGLARRLSESLDATLILQRYSRLVIDCNRPYAALDCMPAASDGTAIPANCTLTDADRSLRLEEIHRPFHDAIGSLLDRREGDRPTIIVTIHSFTPRLGNADRPWQIGVCFNRDGSFAQKFMQAFRSVNPAISAACNEPYTVDDVSDYTIPVHAERRRLPHVLLEVRNDQIADGAGQQRWARLIARSLTDASMPASKEPFGAA